MMATTIDDRNARKRILWKGTGGYAEGLTEVLDGMVDGEGKGGGERSRRGDCYLYRVNMIGAPLDTLGRASGLFLLCNSFVACHRGGTHKSTRIFWTRYNIFPRRHT